jgi:cobyrinic acid a,c-diamide synthase
MSIPALMIAAPQGRSGKTTVAMGLCAVLHRRGLKVKPFKKGPDYIDPSWLTAAAGYTCGNLDPYMFGETILKQAFMRGCQNMDIAVIEASMGLYDSPGEDGYGSSAWLARLLKVPVVLVVNSARMARSAAAMVSGYINFEPGTKITGVILNNVAGQRHRDKLVNAIEKHCGRPVLGCIPPDKGLALKERHIGIVPFIEQEDSAGIIENACAVIENKVDLDRILSVARGTDRLPRRCAPRNDSDTAMIAVSRSCEPKARQEAKQSTAAPIKIGILHDRAFSFYYPDNLESLQKAGAELIFINSFTDSLPDIDGLYIGGGFPELYAAELEANAGLRQAIAAIARDGLPIYAECAGLMYLCNAIIQDGRAFGMCGVIKSAILIEKKHQGHGYVTAEVAGDNAFFGKGSLLRGHEFHHSRLVSTEGLKFAYKVHRGHGVDGYNDGIVYKNVLASFTHLHAWGVPDWAGKFVKLAAARQRAGQKLTV